MSFKRVTEKTEIAATLRAYMLETAKQPAQFLATIKQRGGAEWNGKKMGAGGLIIEGARPMAASTGPDGNTRFQLTNGDSGYTRTIGFVNIDDIEYVETLQSRMNVRVDAPAVASLNSTRDVIAGCISRLVRLLGFTW